jgi:hypothetical protein
MYYKVILVTLLLSSQAVVAQLNATFTTTVNTNCNGSGCNYEGPSILINELMISPTVNDGSISGAGGASTGRGEWIELYNPNLCEPIDISCFYLGNSTAEGAGGFVIPAGTIVPPAGFCMIRGGNAAAVPSNLLVQNGGNVVEVVVPYNITDPGVCAGGTRLWFPNSGGWFAFYDRNGVPQDAVSWAAATNTAGIPCVAQLNGCTAVTSLTSYNNIPADRKNFISTPGNTIPNSWGQSLRRMPDGGAWNSNGTPTYAICNSTCVTPNQSSCTGTATVNVTGGTAPYSYSWNDSQAQLTQTATGLCAGNYTVTVTDNGGLTSQFNVTIVDFVPTVTIDVPSQICIDGSAFAITNVSPIPSGDAVGTITGTGVSSNNFNPQNAGAGSHTITYSYTDENGCSNSAVDNIVVNPLPVVAITNNASPYCISSTPASLTLSPTGGTLSGPGISGNQFVPSVAGVGSHALTYSYTDANGCSNSSSVTAVVVSLPTPVITAPNVLCVNDAPITITATPAGGQFTINGSNGALFNPDQLGAGNHTVNYTYTDPNACQASTSVSINVLPSPTVTIDVPSQICIDGATFAISNISPIASGAAVGTITGPGVTSNNFNPQNAGAGSHNITYSYTDENGCSNSAVDNIVVNPLPVVAITNNASPYCISSTPADLALSPAGGTLSGTGVSANQFIPSVAGVGSHVLTYAYTDANGCSNSTTVTVVVVSIPDPVITAPDFLCVHDEPVTITASPTGGEFTINGTNGALFNPEQLGAGNHTINYLYTDPNGCQASTSETVNVLPRPTISINLQSVFCSNPGVVPLQGTPTGGTFSGDNVNGNNLNLNGVEPGSNSVTYFYQDNNGCENTISASYTIATPINPNFTILGDCFQNITFTPTPLSSSLSYEWVVAGSIASTNPITTINFPISGPNSVTLSITDQNNCSFDSTGVIFVELGVNPDNFVVPNVITANGDNINDQVFIPQLLEDCLEYSIMFVNRWGNLVFEMKDMTNPFRGLDASGNPLSEGIYFYRIESKDLDCESPALTGKCHGFIHVITK